MNPSPAGAPINLDPVLAAYDRSFHPETEPVELIGGFSGARLWRLSAPAGEFCLRRWPIEYPAVEQLEFIQAVLWHVAQEGFTLVPLPVEARSHAGYVRHAGHLWQLEPWIAGAADFYRDPTRVKLQAAMSALGRFHQAAASFPLPFSERLPSPGLAQRQQRLAELISGKAARLAAAIGPLDWPMLAQRGRSLLDLFERAAGRIAPELNEAANVRVALQPCIRDIWHDHVFFAGDEVCGIIDFGALRPENVAADVARLLGSMVGDTAELWSAGLAAYDRVRSLSAHELQLARAFDRSSVLMSGLQWLDWIYLEGRQFADRPRVEARLDELIARLTHLAR